MAVDLTLVVPCCNEIDNIDVLATELMPVVGSLREDRSVEVIFVDDGSRDGTGDALQDQFGGDPDVHVVRHETNRGLGAALRTGFRYAQGNIVIATDADGTYSFQVLPELLAELRPDVDVVTASCYHPKGGIDNVPGYRIFLSRTASLLYRVILDRHVYTYTCLVRAYRRHVLDTISFDSDGFLGVTEILAKAILAGYVVREVPATLHSRRFGSSKARVVRITLAHLRFQRNLIRRRLMGTTAPAISSAAASRRDSSNSH